MENYKMILDYYIITQIEYTSKKRGKTDALQRRTTLMFNISRIFFYQYVKCGC